jgi:hypothetical protein
MKGVRTQSLATFWRKNAPQVKSHTPSPFLLSLLEKLDQTSVYKICKFNNLFRKGTHVSRYNCLEGTYMAFVKNVSGFTPNVNAEPTQGIVYGTSGGRSASSLVTR